MYNVVMDIYSNMNQANTALLIIDPINSCAHKECESPALSITFSKIREMVPKLSGFIEKYREDIGGLVVFTKTVSWKSDFLADNLNELYTDSKTTYYSEDDTGFAEEFYEVKPREREFIITKNTYDAFANTELDKILKDNNIKYLLVTGVFGDGCVLATICGGFSRGYNFVILSDLIETTDVVMRQELLEKLKGYMWPIMYGKTMKSEDFWNSWKNNKEKDS